MSENIEVLSKIYKDSEMSCFSLDELLVFLKDKDNKIKDTVENIKKGYERYKNEALDLLDKLNKDGIEESIMSKMMASMGIKKEVKNDNSDSNIASVLIKGISMGILDMEKIINDYEKKLDKDVFKFSKKFLNFQKDNVEELKKHL